MTETSSTYDTSIAVSVFRRKGGNGAYIRLFDDLAVEVREKLAAISSIGPGEVPVIGGVLPSGNHVLLTSERLLWGGNDSGHDVPIGSVVDARIDVREEASLGHRKDKFDTLYIGTADGSANGMVTEPGTPFFALENVLIWICRRNRRRIRPADSDTNSGRECG